MLLHLWRKFQNHNIFRKQVHFSFLFVMVLQLFIIFPYKIMNLNHLRIHRLYAAINNLKEIVLRNIININFREINSKPILFQYISMIKISPDVLCYVFRSIEFHEFSQNIFKKLCHLLHKIKICGKLPYCILKMIH